MFFIDNQDVIRYMYEESGVAISSTSFQHIVDSVKSLKNLKDKKSTILFLINKYKDYFMDKYFNIKDLFDLNAKFLHAERKLINYFSRDIKYIAEKSLEMLGKVLAGEDIYSIDWSPQDMPSNEEKVYWEIYLKSYYTLYNKQFYEDTFKNLYETVNSLSDSEINNYVIPIIEYHSLM